MRSAGVVGVSMSSSRRAPAAMQRGGMGGVAPSLIPCPSPQGEGNLEPPLSTGGEGSGVRIAGVVRVFPSSLNPHPSGAPSSLKKSTLGRFLCWSAANRGPKKSRKSYPDALIS